MTTPLRILAIHAHPDDIEFQCAGTLALLGQLGHQLACVTMTAGDCGSMTHSPAEISAIRRAEGAAAAKLLGATYECLEFKDLSIVVDVNAKRCVTACLRRHQPDVVFTAPPVDYMDDHEATSRLVRDAAFNAGCPNYDTSPYDGGAPLQKIPYLFYVDPLEGADLWGQPIQPHYYVDTSAVFDLKQQTLAAHASQREWLRAQHGVDEYLDSQRRWSQQRGGEIGVAHAEAFRQHRGHPYPHDDLLVTLLKECVKAKPTES